MANSAVAEITPPESCEIDHPGRAVDEEIMVAAPIERVWSAFADPEHLSGWLVDSASGRAVTGETITWNFEKLGFSAPMHVHYAEAPERLILEPKVDPGGPSQPQEIRLWSVPNGTCARLIHSGFSTEASSDEQLTGVRSDWYLGLRSMRHYVEHYFGQPRNRALVLRPVNASYEKLGHFFREEDGLKQWLTRSGSLPGEGEAFHLTIPQGGRITGTVLADSGREIALSWSEIDGILEFKALTFPRVGRLIGIHAAGWGLSEQRAKWLEASLQTLIARLVAAIEE